MLKIAILWLILDVMAVVILLYDYKRWYGDARYGSFAPDDAGIEQGSDIPRQMNISLPRVVSGKGRKPEQYSIL